MKFFFYFSDKKGGKIVFGDLILVSCNIKKSSTRIDYKLCQTRVPSNSHQRTSHRITRFSKRFVCSLVDPKRGYGATRLTPRPLL